MSLDENVIPVQHRSGWKAVRPATFPDAARSPLDEPTIAPGRLFADTGPRISMANGDRPTGDDAGQSDDAPVDGSGSTGSADLEALRADVAALEDTLSDLQAELADRSGPPSRPPRLRDLRRFTAEVTIPMAILVLETNVRALRILQRALRVDAEERTGGGGETAASVGRRAADASGVALDRLGDALSDLQHSVSAEEREGSVGRLLDEAATLQARVQQELERLETEADTAARSDLGETDGESVPIDVDAELESIKEQVEDEDDAAGG